MQTIVKAAKPAKADKAASVSPSETKAAQAAIIKADNEKQIADKIAAFAAARAIARTHYNGPSLAVHASNRSRTLAAYLAVTATPKQRAASESERDVSALSVAAKHCDAAHTFDPCTYGADLGAISRLSSLGYLTVSGQRIGLTPRGIERAKALKA